MATTSPRGRRTRRAAAFGLCAALVLSAVGCSGDEASAPTGTTTPVDTATPPTTLDPSLGELTLTWTSRVATGVVLISRSLRPEQPTATIPLGPRERTAESLAWAPDGSALLYDSDVEGNFEIYRVTAGTTTPTNLTRSAANEGWPVWSPDGRRIAFFSNRDGQYEPFVMNADGSEVRKLAASPDPVTWLTWSPDGSRVLFVGQSPRANRIFSAPADGNGPATEAVPQAGSQSTPAFSSDGETLAYSAVLPGEDRPSVWLADADGQNPRRLTSNTEPEKAPQFSPDGTKVLYLRSVEGDEGGFVDLIVVRDLAGGEETVVSSTDSATARHPSWSPDGRFIAFTSNRGRDDEIVVTTPDASGAVNASGNPTGPDSWPAWFPTAGAANPFPTA